MAKKEQDSQKLVKLAQAKTPVQRYQAYVRSLVKAGLSTDHINAKRLFANQFKKLLACIGTDAHLSVFDASFRLFMMGQSASACRAALLDAWRLRNLVYDVSHEHGFDPKVKPRFRWAISFDINEDSVIEECHKADQNDSPTHLTLMTDISIRM